MSKTSLLCSFDSNHSRCAILTNDNRIKIWDVASGELNQEILTTKHLTEKYTCIAWGYDPNNQKTKNTKSGTPSKSQTQIRLALGSDNGSIDLYDINKSQHIFTLGGKINENDSKQTKAQAKLGGGHSQRVSDVVFNSNGSFLYSCSEDKYIIIWNGQNGEIIEKFKQAKEPITKLSFHMEGNRGILASAGSKIKCWDLSSKKVITKLSGHTSPVTSLQLFSNKSQKGGLYLLSSSSDRFIYLWRCDQADSNTYNNSPLRVFTSDSTPISLDYNIHSQISDKITLHVLALSEVGILNLFSSDISTKEHNSSQTPQVPNGKVYIDDNSSSKTNRNTIMAGKFFSKDNLIMCFGNNVHPLFDKVGYIDDKGIILSKKIEDIPKQLLMANKTIINSIQLANSNQTINVLGATDMPLPSLRSENKGKEGINEKMLLELKNLNANESEQGSETQAPKADTVRTALVQALHSNDHTLLEYCLHVTDSGVINKTIQKLPPQYIVSLMKAIVDRLQLKPARAASLLLWIKYLLYNHSSYLVSLPNLVNHLSVLYLAIDSRLTSYKKLVKLSGRLDLVLSQVKQGSEKNFIDSNVLFYEESESEGEEEDEEEDGNEDNNDDKESDEKEDEMSDG